MKKKLKNILVIAFGLVISAETSLVAVSCFSENQSSPVVVDNPKIKAKIFTISDQKTTHIVTREDKITVDNINDYFYISQSNAYTLVSVNFNDYYFTNHQVDFLFISNSNYVFADNSTKLKLSVPFNITQYNTILPNYTASDLRIKAYKFAVNNYAQTNTNWYGYQNNTKGSAYPPLATLDDLSDLTEENEILEQLKFVSKTRFTFYKGTLGSVYAMTNFVSEMNYRIVSDYFEGVGDDGINTSTYDYKFSKNFFISIDKKQVGWLVDKTRTINNKEEWMNLFDEKNVIVKFPFVAQDGYIFENGETTLDILVPLDLTAYAFYYPVEGKILNTSIVGKQNFIPNSSSPRLTAKGKEININNYKNYLRKDEVYDAVFDIFDVDSISPNVNFSMNSPIIDFKVSFKKNRVIDTNWPYNINRSIGPALAYMPPTIITSDLLGNKIYAPSYAIGKSSFVISVTLDSSEVEQ